MWLHLQAYLIITNKNKMQIGKLIDLKYITSNKLRCVHQNIIWKPTLHSDELIIYLIINLII